MHNHPYTLGLTFELLYKTDIRGRGGNCRTDYSSQIDKTQCLSERQKNNVNFGSIIRQQGYSITQHYV